MIIYYASLILTPYAYLPRVINYFSRFKYRIGFAWVYRARCMLSAEIRHYHHAAATSPSSPILFLDDTTPNTHAAFTVYAAASHDFTTLYWAAHWLHASPMPFAVRLMLSNRHSTLRYFTWKPQPAGCRRAIKYRCVLSSPCFLLFSLFTPAKGIYTQNNSDEKVCSHFIRWENIAHFRLDTVLKFTKTADNINLPIAAVSKSGLI